MKRKTRNTVLPCFFHQYENRQLCQRSMTYLCVLTGRQLTEFLRGVCLIRANVNHQFSRLQQHKILKNLQLIAFKRRKYTGNAYDNIIHSCKTCITNDDAPKPERRVENLIYTSNFLIIMAIELPSTHLIIATFKAPLLLIPLFLKYLQQSFANFLFSRASFLSKEV